MAWESPYPSGHGGKERQRGRPTPRNHTQNVTAALGDFVEKSIRQENQHLKNRVLASGQRAEFV